jgi:hypothetical protein
MMPWQEQQYRQEFIAKHGQVVPIGRSLLCKDGACISPDGMGGTLYSLPPMERLDRLRAQLDWRKARLRQAEDALRAFTPAVASGTSCIFGSPTWDAEALGRPPTDASGRLTPELAVGRLTFLVQCRREAVVKAEQALAGPACVPCHGGVVLVAR